MDTFLYTRKDVCRLFSVTDRTIRRWEREGILTASCYVANRPRYSIEAVQAAVKDKQNRPKPIFKPKTLPDATA